jgi:exonuclease SbcD
MKLFSFVHTGDLHLDSPFKGISSVSNEISLRLREATFNAYDNIMDLCINRGVDFLLIAGDIYDGAEKSLQAQLRFRRGLLRLYESGIRVYVAHGNHDPLDLWSASLTLPKNIHIFPGDVVERIEYIKDKKALAAIYGRSFATREIRTNLAKKFPIAKKSDPDLYHIGLLHCNLSTSTGHEPYAPCSIPDLAKKNFNYWALGHVHTHAVINKETPVIVYSGNPQGLNPNETGERGCYLVSVEADHQTHIEFVETDSVRWFRETISIDELSSVDELIAAIANVINEVRLRTDDRSALLRLMLSGRSSLHAELVRKGVLDDIIQSIREPEEGESQFVWLESIKDCTQLPIDRNKLLEREDFVGDLIRIFEEFFQDKELQNNLKIDLEELFSSPGGRRWLNPPSDEEILELLQRAESICLDKLLKE